MAESEAERHPTIALHMDAAYERWQANERLAREYNPLERELHWSKEQFRAQLSPQERLAVSIGNLNYQVQNGGWEQWGPHGNAYGTPDVRRYLHQLFERMNTKYATIADALLHSYERIGLRTNLDDRAWERMAKRVEPLSSAYYEIDDDLMDEVEAYMAQGGV